MGKTETNGLKRLNIKLKRIHSVRAFLKLADNKIPSKSENLPYNFHIIFMEENVKKIIQLRMEDHKEIY